MASYERYQADFEYREAVKAKQRAYNATRREAQRQYAVQYVMRKKIEAVAVLGSECMRCGYDEHPAALQFHHRDPATKLFSVNQGLTRPKKYPWSVVLEEIAKCDLLCANCHNVVGCTWELEKWPPSKNTDSST